MRLSQTKVKQLEFIASKFKVNPDSLVDALLDVGLKNPKKKRIKTPKEKVRAIEQEALDKGWTKEQLWDVYKYPRYDLRNVIYYLDDTSEICEVTEKYIAIKHYRSVGEPTILCIHNMKVEQPWITKVKT